MGILAELSKRGINIVKSDRFFKGFYITQKGIVISGAPEECEKGIYFLEDDKNNKRVYPCNDRVVYVISGTEYEGKVNTNQEIEALVKEGKIYSFKSSNLYAEYYDFDNNMELECCFKYGYSSRSRKYIEAVMNNIGLLRYTDASNWLGGEDGEPTDFEVKFVYSLFMNSDTEVGKIESDLWIAQTCYPICDDDFAVIKMYFSHKPSARDVETAFEIRRFERKPVEVFKCWECGKLENWLNLEGSIEKKLEMVEEKYCGC